MPITFSGLVSTVAAAWKGYETARRLLTGDTQLKTGFQNYLSALEHRRVLYAEWEYENIHAVIASLTEIVDRVGITLRNGVDFDAWRMAFVHFRLALCRASRYF